MTDHASSDVSTASGAAWAVGLATVTMDDRRVLDTWYPDPVRGALPGWLAQATGPASAGTVALDPQWAEADEAVSAMVAAGGHLDHDRGVGHVAVATAIDDLADPPLDTHDAYLRLHLLSHRLARPRSLNLDGLFGVLPNVVWTSVGPCPVEDFEQARLRLRTAGRPVQVLGVDKFPRMTDYVVPAGVRIAAADRVRLGAHLASGTTVMHEGFVNFNAGTLGTSMVEGRISAGVVVGDGSDIGGGSSIMGTLSGGGKEVVSVGERCLLGANAGIGISLGDDCVVEAGLYVTAGTVVSLPDGMVAKAGELSGRSGLLYRRNSLSGAVEAVVRSGSWGGLNVHLHRNA